MRRAALLGMVPLLALGLAGCVTTSQPLAAQSLGLPPRFGAPLAMDQPTAGAEPNIAVLPDGTLFIAAVAGSQERPNALEGAAWLWRSADQGATWETLRAPVRDTPLGADPLHLTRRPFGSSDADVVTSPDGWVYDSDWWNWGAPVTGPLPREGSYLVEASGDGGKTWSQAPVTTLDNANGVDRQWLVAGKDGFVGLFYAYFHVAQNLASSALDLYDRADSIMSLDAVFSTDHGKTWSAPQVVVEPIPGHSYLIGHPRLLPDGTLWLPYGDTLQGTETWHNPSRVLVALSHDNGTSWNVRPVADAPEGFDNLWPLQAANDDLGRLFVAWASRAGANMTVSVARSDDQGLHWTAPRTVDEGGLNVLPWVAARGDGQVAVGWYWGNASGEPEQAPNGTAWFPTVAESRDGGATWTVARASGEPSKTGPLCPKGAACTQNRELLDYLSLAYDSTGRLHVAYASSREVAGAKAGLVHYVGAAS